MTRPHVDAKTGSVSIAQRAVRGAFALGVRQILVHGLNITGGILLARLLTPMEFGFLAIVTFLLRFLITFGGSGLAANLIRQDEIPDDRDYQSIFSVQQLAVFTVVVLLWIASPLLIRAYGLPLTDAGAFRLVALSLLATSLMVVPQVKLERELDFDRLAVVEVLQALAFNLTAVMLAAAGHGIYSFAIAVLARSVVGAIVVSFVKPWRLRFIWDWPRAATHLRFGVLYQASNAVSLIKDSISPLFIGVLISLQEVGYVNWAGMVASYAVLALMVLGRLYMPTFARLQSVPDQLGRFVEHALWATNAIVAPISLLLLVLIEPVTRLVFGEKWLVALPMFYFLWGANIFVATATPVVGLLNALGRSDTTFRFALLWMVTTWLLGVPLIWLLDGAIGLAVANLGVQFTNLLLFRTAQRAVPFKILPVVAPVWLIAGLSAGLVYVGTMLWPPTSIVLLVACAISGGAIYLLSLALLYPERANWARQEIARRA
jgi:lipopolysaccharide exporter